MNFGQALFAVPFGWADHLWSLSVEEQFYLVWPTLLLALPPRSVRTALLSLAGAVLVMNAAVAFSGASFLLPLRLPFLGSFLPILSGALLAEGEWSAERTPGPIRRVFRALFLPVGLPLLLLTQWFGSRPGARESSLYLSLVDLAFALLSMALLACFVSPESDGSMLSRIFRWRPLRWVGVLSYGVYLAHRLLEPSAEGALARAGIFSPGVFLLALTIISVCAAAISWYGYERPIQRLKRFFPYADRDPRSR